MRHASGLELTYCLNTHPAETLDEVIRDIRTFSVPIRSSAAPEIPFGLGLWLGHEALREAGQPPKRAALDAVLQENGFYVFTMNGFPYGRFHGRRIKERVYAPDWRSRERLDYTLALIRLLAGWLPEGGVGTISTVPVSFRPWIDNANQLEAAAHRLAACVGALVRLRREEGREIALALEPEPGCVLEKAEDAVRFFRDRLEPQARYGLAAALGTTPAQAEEELRRHIGICFDCCHAAALFLDPLEELDRYRAAGLRVPKVQFSSSLCARMPEALEPDGPLDRLDRSPYLHQTALRDEDGSIRRWPDLTDALAGLRAEAHPRGELRAHCHMPLYWGGAGPFSGTADAITRELIERLKTLDCRHGEVETYTLNTLSGVFPCRPPVESVVAEYRWLLSRLKS